MAKRNVIPGIVLRPEVFRISNSELDWFATRYIIYADRAKQKVLLDGTYTGVSKESLSYTVDMFDDTVIFFTTNIQLSDGSWVGESPLTPVILRKTRVSSSGIIITPEIATTFIGDDLIIKGSYYTRYEGTAIHESSDWVIEDDVTGELIYRREYDRDNLREIRISSILLDPLKSYRVQLRYRDVLGKVSNYGSDIIIRGDILCNIIPNDNIRLGYGDSIKLSNKDNIKYLDTAGLELDIFKNKVLIKKIKYSDGFYIDSKDYNLGDVLKGIVSYGEYTRTIDIIIVSKDTEEEIDSKFSLSGYYKLLNADNFNLNGVSTSKQNKDGYIYDIDHTNKKLVRVVYDDVDNKLTKKDVVLDLASVILHDITYRTVINNPYGGLILFLSSNDGLSNSICFVDIYDGTYSLSKTIPLLSNLHSYYSITFNSNYFILGGYVYMYAKYMYNNIHKTRLLKLDLLNKTIIDNNDIIDGLDNVMAGYSVVKRDSKVLFFKSGIETANLGDDALANIGKVFKTAIDGVELTPDIDIPNPMNVVNAPLISRLVRLKNDRIAFLYAPSIENNTAGIVEIDSETHELTDRRSNIPSTVNHRIIYTLNDGRIITANTDKAILFY